MKRTGLLHSFLVGAVRMSEGRPPGYEFRPRGNRILVLPRAEDVRAVEETRVRSTRIFSAGRRAVQGSLGP